MGTKTVDRNAFFAASEKNKDNASSSSMQCVQVAEKNYFLFV
jgi:hypothetical protein